MRSPRLPATLRRMLPALLAAALAAACEAGTGPESSPTPTQVRIAADSVQLYVGEGAVIPAAALDEDGDPVPGARLSWSTSDPAVAVVDSAGRVFALRPGRAEVGVHLEGASVRAASIGVRVAPRPDRLEIGRDTVTIVAPGTATACEVFLSAALFDRSGARMFGQPISYAVKDTSVAGVRRPSGGTAGITSGYVFGKRAGETRLIASSGGYQDTALVRVLPGSPSAVRVFRAPEWAEGRLTPGDTLWVRGEVLNECGRPVPGLPVTFSSADSAIVQVSPSGRVLGLSAGTARVFGSWQQARPDYVPVYVTEYRILPADTTVFVGDTLALRGTMSFHAGETYPVYSGQFRYMTSDSTVVRLLERGESQRALAVGEGEAWITAEGAGRARARVRVLRRP